MDVWQKSGVDWEAWRAIWLKPVTAVWLGLAMAGVALGSDLIGLGDGAGMGPKQWGLLLAGVVLAAFGLVMDWRMGQHQVTAWWLSLALDRGTAVKFAAIVLQFGLLVLVAHEFHLENQAFYNDILVLAFFGFVVHYFLPRPYRQPFFLILSIGGIAGVLGVGHAAWLIGIGLLLVMLVHLPLSWRWRTGLLLGVGLLLALMRADVIETPWLTAVWPILGSMFMFRLIIYAYDMRHSKEKVNLARSLSYFFMLPNVVFPFFPVVDYSAYRRNYYNNEQHQIYQKGIEFMFLGVFQLVLYRYINYFLTISPTEVQNAADLARYLSTNFALYLRISGQFHLIIGMMHMFGFNLPETNRHYFLASSFTDLWRRINIYWKDFMMKVFYYPIYFRLRHLGPMKSIGLATAVVFIITWALHSYQWFWLRGVPLLSVTDAVFWLILGGLVVANSLYEAKHGRKRTLAQHTRSFKDISATGLRILATFTIMSTLWALWSSPSVSDWLSLLSVAGKGFPNQTTSLTSLLVVGILYEGSFRWRTPRTATKKIGPKNKKPWFYKSVGVTLASILILYMVGNPAIYSKLNQSGQSIIGDLRVSRLSNQDTAKLERGYYENLNDINSFNSQLWEIYMKRPDEWPSLWETEAVRQTNDFLKGEHVPLIGMIFHGQPYHTNRWGMRDQDYELLPPANTYRIAMIGSSHLEGWGVEDGENFESQLERKLNQETPGEYEILNFGMGAYTPPQELYQFENRILQFRPDAIFYFAHPYEADRAIRHIVDRVQANVPIPYPFLQNIIEETGITSTMSEEEITRALTPYGNEIITWTYNQFVQQAEEQQILPVWIYLPAVPGIAEPEQEKMLISQAASAGFSTISLADVYDGQDRFAIRVAEWDLHPNKIGHQLIAERLLQEITTNTDLNQVKAGKER